MSRAVGFDERVGLVVREGAVHLEAQARRAAGQAIEQPGRHQARHAVAGVEDHVEGRDATGIDEAHHVLDVLVEERRGREGAALRRRRGNRPPRDHVADVREAGVAAERKRVAADQLGPVVRFGVVRGGDLRAAIEPGPGDAEVDHVGRDRPKSTTAAPCSGPRR